jgi:hypothetical protein
MAVFVAASDETSGGNVLSLYHYAGWVMPESDWSKFFVPAWKERVLDGPPEIPYLHMTEMRSRAWREKYGITQTDADDRLDEAALVIDQMGSLYPIKVTIDGSIFRPMYKDFKMLSESGGVKKYEPDFLAFTSYAFAVCLHLHHRYPEAEKIDFVVESNGEITKHIHQLYKKLPGAFEYVGRPELVSLIGEFLPAGKVRMPLQAADYLCWHSQRAKAGTLDDRDARRWYTISNRKGFDYTIPTSTLISIAKAYEEKERDDGILKGIQGIRPNNAGTREGSPHQVKSRARRRKGGKSKKAKG